MHIPTKTLKRDLLVILFLGVVLAFALQVATRVFSELPGLYRIEEESDRNAVRQVQLHILSRVQLLENVALNHSIWDDTHDFIGMTPGSTEWLDYLYVVLDYPWDTFLIHNANGIIFLDEDQSLVYRYTIDLNTGKPDRELDLTHPHLRDVLTTKYRPESHREKPPDPVLLNAGFLQTHQGPIVFAAAEIHRTDIGESQYASETDAQTAPPTQTHFYRASGESRGTLIFWRYFDERCWDLIEESVGIKLDFLSFSEASTDSDLDGVVAALLSSPDTITARGKRDHVFWLLRDVRDVPVMLVRQYVPTRNFTERWIATPVLVGFGASVAVLLLFGVFLSERVLKPVAHLRDVAARIGEGNLRLTAHMAKEDEIGELSQSINQMSANLLEAREHLEELAYKDKLTGLANRRPFMEFVRKAIDTAKRKKEKLAILFIDLDGFKGVNDIAGHEAGDYVLQQVAERLIDCLRGDDFITRMTEGVADEASFEASRFGGDEFVVLVAHLDDPSSVSIVSDRMRQALAVPYVFEGVAHNITCSVGIAVYPEDGDNHIELVKNANYAMNSAKMSGKNQGSYYDPVTSAKASERLRIRNALSRAIVEDQLRLHYQPLYSLSSGQMIGGEALLRWTLPDGESVSPAVFIPIAENSGQMKDIGLWVLEEACRQQTVWREQGIDPLRTFVNVSAHQFPHTDFGRQVEAVMRRHDIGPETLGIEITETSMMEGTADVNTALKAIFDMGVSIGLDDFGTGYSSLAMLKTLPIDNVKIDKRFIDEITKSADGGAIVNAVIAMCNRLGLSTTAEGVEIEEQLSFLKDVGCDFVQGFLLNRPMAAEKMTGLIIQAKTPNILDFKRASGSA